MARQNRVRQESQEEIQGKKDRVWEMLAKDGRYVTNYLAMQEPHDKA